MKKLTYYEREILKLDPVCAEKFDAFRKLLNKRSYLRGELVKAFGFACEKGAWQTRLFDELLPEPASPYPNGVDWNYVDHYRPYGPWKVVDGKIVYDYPID